MRPVNLIPTEQRSGVRRPMRGGPLAYIVIGALVAAVLGVTLLVVTSNQISDSKSELTQLETEKAEVDALALELDAYTQFHTVSQQRTATVTGLADSRFDWERVMRELALVLPDDVWLTNLTGSAAPGAAPNGGANISLRGSIAGPALELVGCARSQEAVAGLIQAIKDIDGVTRVGVPSSAIGSEEGAGSSGGSGTNCQTRDFITQFQLVAAFDAAPIASEAAGVEVEATEVPSTTTSTTEE
jgi:Tfp pilus assembly protein PilN